MREHAANYRREVAERTVARTVDCVRRRPKRLAISRRLTGHPFRQNNHKINHLGQISVVNAQASVHALCGRLSLD